MRNGEKTVLDIITGLSLLIDKVGNIAHYVAIHCLCQRTTGTAAEQPADIPLPQSATLCFYPITSKLLLICYPATVGR